MMAMSLTNIAHTASTDHTISRRKGEEKQNLPDLAMDEWPIVHFHRDRVDMNDPERKRDLAVGLMRLVTGDLMPPNYQRKAIGMSSVILEDALKRAPSDPWGWLAWGNALIREQRVEDARKAYETVLEQMPHHEEALERLADLELSQGRKDLTTGYLKRTVEANPHDVLFRRKLGTHLAQVGDWKGAAEQAKRWIKIEPGSSAARQLLVIALLELKQLEEARKEFETIRKLKPLNLTELELEFKKRGG
jgi:tetratricopeptide (TPR) repeat protein